MAHSERPIGVLIDLLGKRVRTEELRKQANDLEVAALDLADRFADVVECGQTVRVRVPYGGAGQEYVVTVAHEEDGIKISHERLTFGHILVWATAEPVAAHAASDFHDLDFTRVRTSLAVVGPVS